MSEMRDFSGGPAVKSLPANVGARGSTPGQELNPTPRRVSPWTITARPVLSSPCTATPEASAPGSLYSATRREAPQ